ncbi:hypothetical protein LMG22037_00573 [Paraburkholderia phenoliruptrix]|jgi:hypothetical protein|uniref:Uncharacterized protein n=1 Tax=Paraburkholderia phenoliruptrix TaxID=252970 RepID=A0A6J5A0H8_9BURK|nr:hypothetical protein [Paraburkholderia phenoliruptrix]CAB3644247.1 hypothetical protein LMG22037_00573 [Paraburkholderia phenoliruptrix]
MVSTRPCTATCVIDGMPVTLTFYPDNGVLRIADPSGTCIKETHWHASWRSLLDEFRRFGERAAMQGPGVEAMVSRIVENTEDAATQTALA